MKLIASVTLIRIKNFSSIFLPLNTVGNRLPANGIQSSNQQCRQNFELDHKQCLLVWTNVFPVSFQI